MATEPLVTWNLVLCSVAFPALGFFIRKLFEDMQKNAVDRYSLLHEEIRSIKSCMAGMKEDIKDKVDESACNTKSKEKWERINRHTHDDQGRVVIT